MHSSQLKGKTEESRNSEGETAPEKVFRRDGQVAPAFSGKGFFIGLMKMV